jgi:uncharacterized protein (DUF1330 family)
MSEVTTTRVQTLVALDVLDEDKYQKYRDGMLPILHEHGGQFVVDVKLGTVLKLPKQGPVNRMFTIEFPSLERLEAFFSNPDYLVVRKQYFESSVGNVCGLGKYQVL